MMTKRIYFLLSRFLVICVLFLTFNLKAQDYSLPSSLSGTSGVITYKGNLITMNDHADNNLYVLDTMGNVLRSVNTHLDFVDCEEISEDSLYVYLGDFGNNSNGNRQNLRIFRFLKSWLDSNSVANVDTIFFSYSNQTDFSASQTNQTDFDCEAMIVTDSLIYLFSKQWHSLHSALYSLPKQSGTYTAQLISQYNISGLVTGATYLKEEKELFLVGYSKLLEPFYVRLSAFNGDDFFSGNVEKSSIPLPFCQMEAITRKNGYIFYTTNESVSYNGINVSQKLHRMDLSFYLHNVNVSKQSNGVALYPIPAKDYVIVRGENITTIVLYDLFGRRLHSYSWQKNNKEQKIDVHLIEKGEYLLVIKKGNGENVSKILMIE